MTMRLLYLIFVRLLGGFALFARSVRQTRNLLMDLGERAEQLRFL